MDDIKKNYIEIKNRIHEYCLNYSREPSEVALLAVSKKHSIEKIKILYDLGQRDFGENYAQELLEKVELAKKYNLSEIRWHFIGHLQSNKVKSILPHITMIHSICSLSVVQEILKYKTPENLQKFLLEINIDNEESKSGLKISEIESFLETVKKINFNPSGFMIIPKSDADSNIENSFKKCAELSTHFFNSAPPILSMGMSDDFKFAIKQGSHFIRIGTLLFGNRV